MEKGLIKFGLIFLSLLVIFHPLPGRGDEKESGNIEQHEKSMSKNKLSSEEKKYLLSLSRKTLEQYLKKGEIIKVSPENLSPALRKMRGCFVTLTKNGRLRGCIGYLQPRKPLCDCVIENTINAAVHDTRFPVPVSLEELDSITIEISVLTVPKKLELKNRAELPDHLAAGRDGLILRRGWRQATYLPQVWEYFPTKKDFLNSLCQKGGMSAGCWRNQDTEIFTYQAVFFHE